MARTLVCRRHLFLKPDCSRGTREFPSAHRHTLPNKIFSKILEWVESKEIGLVWWQPGTPAFNLFKKIIFAVFQKLGNLHSFNHTLKQLTKHSIYVGGS